MSKLIVVKRSYLVIRYQMEANLVMLESFSKGYKFVFHEDFPIPIFTSSKLSVNRNTKICFGKLNRPKRWGPLVLIPESFSWYLSRSSNDQGCSRGIWLQFDRSFDRMIVWCFVLFKQHDNFVIWSSRLQPYFYLSLMRTGWPPDFNIVISFLIRNTLGRVFFSFSCEVLDSMTDYAMLHHPAQAPTAKK